MHRELFDMTASFTPRRRASAASSGAAALLLGACLAIAGAPRALGQAAAAPSLLAGAYTEEQALQGRTLYYQQCLLCHGETMAGVDKAPPLAGPQFISTWSGAPLTALVARILTMPPEKPNSLSPEESVAILTYILWYNGLPLGDAPLASAPDVLGKVAFEIPSRE
jgi:mono/diheme cytochrome c family protein